jgi:hypothetical protein
MRQQGQSVSWTIAFTARKWCTYEIRHDLEDPIWLRQDHGADVEETPLSAQEGLVLHPGDDIMQRP